MRGGADGARQTPGTAATVLHSHLALKTGFPAAHSVTSHSNGISALALQGIGGDHAALQSRQFQRFGQGGLGRAVWAGR